MEGKEQVREIKKKKKKKAKAIILTRCITLLRNNMPAMLLPPSKAIDCLINNIKPERLKLKLHKCIQKRVERLKRTHTHAIRSSQFTINVIKCISALLPLTCTVLLYCTYPIPSQLHYIVVQAVHTHKHTVFFPSSFYVLDVYDQCTLVIYFICLSVSLLVYQPTSLNFSAFPLNWLLHCFFPQFFFHLNNNTIQRNARAQLEQIMHLITIIYVIFLAIYKKHYFNLKLREQKR